MSAEKKEPPVRRHTFRQEEARMLSSMYKAEDVGNEWRLWAFCKDDESPDDWFAPDGTTEAASATAACFNCPVREECLEWASLSKQRQGIWGGQPASVRIPKGSGAKKDRPHDYDRLVDLPDPYLTDNTKSRFHSGNLTDWNGEDDE